MSVNQQRSSTDVLAPIELGTLVSSILYGVMCTQAYSYTQHFKNKDPLALRVLVRCLDPTLLGMKQLTFCSAPQLIVIVILETFHLALTFVYLYTLTITNFNNPPSLNQISWSFAATFTVISISDSMVQAFYAYRMRKLLGSWLPLIIPALFILARVVDGIYATSKMIIAGTMSAFAVSDKFLCDLNLALKLATDLYITVGTCWLLAKNRPTWQTYVRDILDQLILWTAEVGLLNSIGSLIVLILIRTMDNMVWTFFILINPRLISNSLFAMLNGRSSMDRPSWQVYAPQTVDSEAGTTSYMSFAAKTIPGKIRVDIQKETESDSTMSSSVINHGT
jgi:hypothetical protein